MKAFLDRDYNVVATLRKSKDLPSCQRLILMDGDIGVVTTTTRVAENSGASGDSGQRVTDVTHSLSIDIQS